jgi:hypothetical protein
MPAKAVATVPITGILRVTGQGGNHIVQINPFKSVDTICGHYMLVYVSQLPRYGIMTGI